MIDEPATTNLASARVGAGCGAGRRELLGALGPTERSILTREGFLYFLVSLTLLVAGLIQQVNLILLVFTLAAGPFLASIFGGRSMLRRLIVQRRVPGLRLLRRSAGHRLRPGERPAVVCGAGLVHRRFGDPGGSLGLGRGGHDAAGVLRADPGRERSRLQWQCPSPKRGKYRFRDLDVGTRAPFGIVEHRVTISLTDQIVVYPRIGQLTRRWFLIQRQATENRRGQRHDQSAQQMEYHGLRDYRSGDSPRWIHWRTSARSAAS